MRAVSGRGIGPVRSSSSDHPNLPRQTIRIFLMSSLPSPVYTFRAELSALLPRRQDYAFLDEANDP